MAGDLGRLRAPGSWLERLRNSGLTVAGLLVLLSAAGWLYLIRPSLGSVRPAVPDALPLDELANKAGVSLFAFVAVWGSAACAESARASPSPAAIHRTAMLRSPVPTTNPIKAWP